MKRPILFPLRHSLRQIVLAFLVLLATIGVLLHAQESERRQPELSGVTKGNTGCAVLEKHTPIKGKLLAAGVIYARTEYVVLDSVSCKLPKDKYTGPGGIKALNQYATDNKIKLVVIPRNYTDQEFVDAKDICRQKPSPQPASPAPTTP